MFKNILEHLSVLAPVIILTGIFFFDKVDHTSDVDDFIRSLNTKK